MIKYYLIFNFVLFVLCLSSNTAGKKTINRLWASCQASNTKEYEQQSLAREPRIFQINSILSPWCCISFWSYIPDKRSTESLQPSPFFNSLAKPKHANVTHRAASAFTTWFVSAISHFTLLLIVINCRVILLSYCWILINFVILLPESHTGEVGNMGYTHVVILSVIALSMVA